MPASGFEQKVTADFTGPSKHFHGSDPLRLISDLPSTANQVIPMSMGPAGQRNHQS